MWKYNPTTRTTDASEGIIPRVKIEAAIDALYLQGGLRNQLLMIDVVKALSGLGRGEVTFNVQLAMESLIREGKA